METSKTVKSESEDPNLSTLEESKDVKLSASQDQLESTKSECETKAKYFQCEICDLREHYDYFGNDPPFTKHYKLLENAYVIEDPFIPPKQSEFIILGSHCIKCCKSVCKDNNCSLYYDGTYCIHCAKSFINVFPQNVQEKLNRIVT